MSFLTLPTGNMEQQNVKMKDLTPFSKVFVTKCTDYDVNNIYSNLKKSIGCFDDLSSFIKKGEKVLLKPNMIIGKKPEFHVNTHPAIVESIAKVVLECGGIPEIGDSPQRGTATELSRIIGYDKIASKLNIKIVDFTEPRISFYKDSKIYKKFEIDKKIFGYDKIINLAKLKTHASAIVSLSIKNIFGVISGPYKIEKHLNCRDNTELFATMLLELYNIVKPSFNIVDGIYGMEGDGPTDGVPRKLNMLICGNDGIAVDRVICELLGIDHNIVPIFKANKKLKIGEDNIKNIEILNENIDDLKVSDFKLPTTVSKESALPIKLLKRIVKSVLNDYFLTRPVISQQLCKKCFKCIKVCPFNAISNKNNLVKIDKKKCMRCYCCHETCEYGAIKIKKGLI